MQFEQTSLHTQSFIDHSSFKKKINLSMARKREACEGEEQTPSSLTVEEAASWDEMVKDAGIGGVRRARKRFVGVWQRPSGRWVVEVKDTTQMIRVWLGTYNTVEEATPAYSEAA